MTLKLYRAVVGGLLALVLGCGSGAYAAKNVVLMIGDGMGFNHVKAGSYYLTGEPARLCFAKYYRCRVRTSDISGGVTDSAAAASAIATGHKVAGGVVSQDPAGEPYETILEVAKGMGKATGLVTTVPITHATPAGFGAHDASRGNVIAIGEDFLDSSRPNVLFGGGDPKKGTGYWNAALTQKAASLGYATVYDYAQMNALDVATTTMALGLFSGEDMTYEFDRTKDNKEPHLSQMVTKTLSLLEDEPDGFFIMVEGGMIDHAAHGNDINRATREVVEFNNAVQSVLNWMKGRNDTLLIVTADHETGGLDVTDKGAKNYPGATWSTGGHTGANVPLYCCGADSMLIGRYMRNGAIENTDIFRMMCAAFGVAR